MLLNRLVHISSTRLFRLLVLAIILRFIYLIYLTTLSNVNISVIFVEMIFLTIICNTIENKIIRSIVIVPAVIISSFDLVHIAITGIHTIPLTLMHLNIPEVQGRETIIKIVLYFAVYIILWLPDLISPSIKLLKHWCNNVAFLFMLLACFFLYKGSLNSFTLALYDTTKIITTKKLDPIKESKKYEHIKKEFFKDSVVLRSSNLKILNQSLSDYNVIVLFAEGMSLDVISKEVTPNTFKLMQDSLVVDNYYNHTAATLRGLRGQLTSSYQNRAGISKIVKDESNKEEVIAKDFDKLESLPSILNDHNYNTLFINPQRSTSNLSYLMRFVGYDTVIGCQEDEPTWSDEKLYQRIWKETDRLLNKDQPFFLTSYIFGTHDGLNSKKIKFGDGSNRYLNKFFEQDHWLGNFLDKFNNSQKTDKTILIFTSDHSTFPTKQFRETFNIKNTVYVDKIPFFIYVKNLTPRLKEHERHTNNVKRNSLAFAPTILDLLNIHKADNHFLGTSVFDIENNKRNISLYERFSLIEDSAYYIADNDEIIKFSLRAGTLDFLKINEFLSFAG